MHGKLVDQTCLEHPKKPTHIHDAFLFQKINLFHVAGCTDVGWISGKNVQLRVK